MDTLIFPYITGIKVNDCYAAKDLSIPVFEENEKFRHLILTGKNGSGKTTILKELNNIWNQIRLGQDYLANIKDQKLLVGLTENIHHQRFTSDLESMTRIEILFSNPYNDIFNKKRNHIYRFFQAQRLITVENVSSPLKEADILEKVNNSNQGFSSYLKHYLVNLKIYQAFEIIDNKQNQSEEIERFFNSLESVLRQVFEDKGLTLKFIRETYDFIIVNSDGREVDFNQLSSGFSAFLDILSELIIQKDLIQKEAKDYSYNPPGLVLIDEPENHGHLAMQEQILPLLTALFPAVQFIVATHSPAVIASIANATVYDLTTKQVFRENLVGSSYSQLMVKLFGLKNQYSTLADGLIDEVNNLLLENDNEKARVGLKKLLESKKELLSESIILEIESAILQIQEA